ncbi:hypothetical protein [Paludifilum halophilum]|uniref:Uncharacterized protein n=1 Tax=Paludifilum halophilum TaxID=1642702 RepID=A0A235B4V0_9BACL|nr:hypothetical protein [Paludifilum halophilum]OYD07338.1 hypothetical protein CHM34_10510 [Paludifilum halophilum]
MSRRKRFNFGEQKKMMQQQIDENEEKVHANVRKKDEEDKPGAKKEFSPSKAKKADSKPKDVVDGNDNVGTGSNVSDAGNHSGTSDAGAREVAVENDNSRAVVDPSGNQNVSARGNTSLSGDGNDVDEVSSNAGGSASVSGHAGVHHSVDPNGNVSPFESRSESGNDSGNAGGIGTENVGVSVAGNDYENYSENPSTAQQGGQHMSNPKPNIVPYPQQKEDGAEGKSFEQLEQELLKQRSQKGLYLR